MDRFLVRKVLKTESGPVLTDSDPMSRQTAECVVGIVKLFDAAHLLIHPLISIEIRELRDEPIVGSGFDFGGGS